MGQEHRRSVEISLSGVEIAKWLRNSITTGQVSGRVYSMASLTVGVGRFIITHVDMPIEVTLDDALRLPTIGAARIDLKVLPDAILDYYELGTGQLSITAVCLLMEHGVPVDQAERMEVRVIND